MQMSLNGLGKESPRVLQVRDSHHGNDAGYELNPTIGNSRGVNQGGRRSSHRYYLHDGALYVNSALQERQPPRDFPSGVRVSTGCPTFLVGRLKSPLPSGM